MTTAEETREAEGGRPEILPADLTTGEACRYLNVSRPTLYARARTLRIKVVRHGRAVRWPLTELDLLRKLSMRQMR